MNYRSIMLMDSLGFLSNSSAIHCTRAGRTLAFFRERTYGLAERPSMSKEAAAAAVST